MSIGTAFFRKLDQCNGLRAILKGFFFTVWYLFSQNEVDMYWQTKILLHLHSAFY